MSTNANDNAALNTTHTMTIRDMWVEGRGDGNTVVVSTRWFDTQAAADLAVAEFTASGCHFARVFEQRSSALGPFRAVGHKVAE